MFLFRLLKALHNSQDVIRGASQYLLEDNKENFNFDPSHLAFDVVSTLLFTLWLLVITLHEQIL